MRRGEPPAAAEGLERQERADGGRGGSRARRRESRRKRLREDTRASCRRCRVGGQQLVRGAPAATRGQEKGRRRPPTLACVPSGARACDPPEPAAAPPSPALTAPRGAAAAAAASSVPASPARRKSPPRTWAPGSAGGKTRDSKIPRYARLEQPSQTFLWIKRNTNFFFFFGRRKGKEDRRGSARKKKGGCNSWIRFFFPHPSNILFYFVNIFSFKPGSIRCPPDLRGARRWCGFFFSHWGLWFWGFLRDPLDISRGVKSPRPPPSSLRVHRIRGDPVTKDIEEKNRVPAFFFNCLLLPTPKLSCLARGKEAFSSLQ